MKTGRNKATNNFIIRIWSGKYYNTKSSNYQGTITDVLTKDEKHFHSAGDFLKKLELMNKNAEKGRK